MEQALAEREAFAVALVDLDRFKQINDTLGHHNGDRLLVELSRRLGDHIGGSAFLARLGGDEFGAVIRPPLNPESVLWEARELLGVDADVSGIPVSAEASARYALSPDDGLEADVLLRRAEVAMYAAKSRHDPVTRYDPSLDHHDPDGLSLGGELRQALAEQQLVVHLQPQVELASGRLTGVESLVRWQHPVRGLLAPGMFLPLAEQTDLIEELTRQVLRMALRGLRQLGPAAENLTLSVNASARNIVRESFKAEVLEILDEHQTSPGRLVVKVTETALLTDPERAVKVLPALSAAGVRISLDDFGSGQTSLGYLSALPLDKLKIDRGFVSDMVTRKAHTAIVRSVTELGHNLGLRVVAEGVEDEQTLDCLRGCGYDRAQGYMIARPMSVAALADWLRAREGLAGAGQAAAGGKESSRVGV